ncbi:MAG: hypothetical protein PHV20_11610 [Bacteroidales bacterium]|nr:hypothetical protein [Bacteroidales bacterium]
MNTLHQKAWNRRRIFFLPLIVIGFSALTALVMFLWNWLVPSIFHLTAITFWQAAGLFALSRLLFGGFHFKRHRHRPPFANPQFRDKFMNMTDEEKADFKNQWKHRCCK